jgi:AcrR family transcriptional regulator
MPARTDAGATRAARGEATRERLLSAAVELLEEGGYAAASVAAIAERGGVSAGALYRHFPSKAELFVEVFRTSTRPARCRALWSTSSRR